MQGNYLLGAALACTSGAPVSAGVVHAASMHRVQQLDALGGGCSKCMRSQHHPLTCMFFIHGTLLSTLCSASRFTMASPAWMLLWGFLYVTISSASARCPFAHATASLGVSTTPPSRLSASTFARDDVRRMMHGAPRRAAGTPSMWAGSLPASHNVSDPLVQLNRLLFPAYAAASASLQAPIVLLVVRVGSRELQL